MLRGQVADIAVGSIFLFVGLAACAIAALHRRERTRIFAWLGIWSGLYGAVQLTQSAAVLAASPPWAQAGAPYANAAMMYLLIVFGLLSFRELSVGKMRRVLEAAAALGLAIAISGIAVFAFTGSPGRLLPYNNALAAGMLVLLMTVIAAPRLSARHLTLPDRRVLAAGVLVFAAEALYNSVSRPMGFGASRLLDHLGFAVLLLSFGYAALQMVLANERRLLSVDNELAIARQIQTSILPDGVPELNGAAISAAYLPMSAVAGDFYEFLPLDRNRAGCPVADVCGHGVPAALIASMVKVAVQTVAACANDPGEVMRGLNHVLSGQLRGQLVSAAYLWLDMEKRTALYSAAGHPPLLRWRDGALERIESNGILFGVLPQYGAYPVRAIPLAPGDRFLLCTDGVTEPENARGEAFGDCRLEQVLRDNPSCAPGELSRIVLSEIRRWQPGARSQQDDITLVIVDAL